MRHRLMAVAAVLVALFTTTAAAATKVAESGCCPFCK